MTSEGCSWKYADAHGETTWSSGNNISNQPSPGGSINNPALVIPVEKQLTASAGDLTLDVTNMVKSMTGSTYLTSYPGDRVPNHGFLIQREESRESDKKRRGSFQFFSKETHTIYQPRLQACWDESSWSEGSLSELNISDPSRIFFYLKNNRGNYRYGEKAKFRIVGREKYPTKTYGTTSVNLSVKHIPSGSAFYSVKDLKTGEVVIPYDTTFTKMSCESSGNYFEIYTDSLEKERYYQIELKLYPSGSQPLNSLSSVIGYYPIKDIFKVTK